MLGDSGLPGSASIGPRILGIQGTVPVGTDLGLVEIDKRLGVVHMLMAYHNRNHVADGCHERTDAGLSSPWFGR